MRRRTRNPGFPRCSTPGVGRCSFFVHCPPVSFSIIPLSLSHSPYLVTPWLIMKSSILPLLVVAVALSQARYSVAAQQLDEAATSGPLLDAINIVHPDAGNTNEATVSTTNEATDSTRNQTAISKYPYPSSSSSGSSSSDTGYLLPPPKCTVPTATGSSSSSSSSSTTTTTTAAPTTTSSADIATDGEFPPCDAGFLARFGRYLDACVVAHTRGGLYCHQCASNYRADAECARAVVLRPSLDCNLCVPIAAAPGSQKRAPLVSSATPPPSGDITSFTAAQWTYYWIAGAALLLAAA